MYFKIKKIMEYLKYRKGLTDLSIINEVHTIIKMIIVTHSIIETIVLFLYFSFTFFAIAFKIGVLATALIRSNTMLLTK
mgnify:CR=1 FL=1